MPLLLLGAVLLVVSVLVAFFFGALLMNHLVLLCKVVRKVDTFLVLQLNTFFFCVLFIPTLFLVIIVFKSEAT